MASSSTSPALRSAWAADPPCSRTFRSPADRWGQGLGLAAARAGLDHALRVLHVDEVWAEALHANTRSVRILQRLGMQETGRGKAGHFLSQPTFYRRFTTGAASSSRRV